MDYTIVRLTAEAGTGNVIEALWMLSHTVGIRSAHRSGVVRVPLIPTPVQFGTVTELQAVQIVKDVLGATYMADIEASVLAELTAEADTVTGTPWGQVPPPAVTPEPIVPTPFVMPPPPPPGTPLPPLEPPPVNLPSEPLPVPDPPPAETLPPGPALPPPGAP